MSKFTNWPEFLWALTACILSQDFLLLFVQHSQVGHIQEYFGRIQKQRGGHFSEILSDLTQYIFPPIAFSTHTFNLTKHSTTLPTKNDTPPPRQTYKSQSQWQSTTTSSMSPWPVVAAQEQSSEYWRSLMVSSFWALCHCQPCRNNQTNKGPRCQILQRLSRHANRRCHHRRQPLLRTSPREDQEDREDSEQWWSRWSVNVCIRIHCAQSSGRGSVAGANVGKIVWDRRQSCSLESIDTITTIWCLIVMRWLYATYSEILQVPDTGYKPLSSSDHAATVNEGLVSLLSSRSR